MRGAGGTSGGIGQFFIGFIMMCGGFYLLLNSINVISNFGFGARLYSFSGGRFGITSGMIMIPFMFGVGLVFYNAKNIFAWLLSVGSITALIFGVISSIRFSFAAMSAFDLIVILILTVGGIGLFIRSLKTIDRAYPD